jgi:hypothetical protein
MGYMLFQDTQGFTGGMGINYETRYGIYKIDFAWVPQNYLGDNFRLTLNYKWGERMRSSRINSRVITEADEKKPDGDAGKESAPKEKKKK